MIDVKPDVEKIAVLPVIEMSRQRAAILTDPSRIVEAVNAQIDDELRAFAPGPGPF